MLCSCRTGITNHHSVAVVINHFSKIAPIALALQLQQLGWVAIASSGNSVRCFSHLPAIRELHLHYSKGVERSSLPSSSLWFDVVRYGNASDMMSNWKKWLLSLHHTAAAALEDDTHAYFRNGIPAPE